jgi:hypothetical protein
VRTLSDGVRRSGTGQRHLKVPRSQVRSLPGQPVKTALLRSRERSPLRKSVKTTEDPSPLLWSTESMSAVLSVRVEVRTDPYWVRRIAADLDVARWSSASSGHLADVAGAYACEP